MGICVPIKSWWVAKLERKRLSSQQCYLHRLHTVLFHDHDGLHNVEVKLNENWGTLAQKCSRARNVTYYLQSEMPLVQLHSRAYLCFQIAAICHVPLADVTELPIVITTTTRLAVARSLSMVAVLGTIINLILLMSAKKSVSGRMIQVCLSQALQSRNTHIFLRLCRPSYAPPEALCFRHVRLSVCAFVRSYVRTCLPSRGILWLDCCRPIVWENLKLVLKYFLCWFTTFTI